MTVFDPPPSPRTVADTGVERRLLLDLLLKLIYVRGLSSSIAIAREACLSSPVTTELLEEARDIGLVETLGLRQADAGNDMHFNLTSKGVEWASGALELSQYVGPVPVSLEAFSEQVERQRLSSEQVDREALEASFAGLVLPQRLLERLGPAANSSKSVLLFGSAGNGKSRIAEGIAAAFADVITFPHAIVVDGQVINFRDTHLHRPPAGEDPQAAGNGLRVRDAGDRRWFRCRRPVAIVGGELTLDMLDLTFNPVGKFYEAPAQLKATNGVFVLDDFGRQRTSARSILNRWIVPLERGVDYLTLHTGKKFPVPFDELVVFSTNMHPADIGDDAMLRRLYYKIEVPEPTREDYDRIWKDEFASRGLDFSDELMSYLEQNLLQPKGIPRAGYHARYTADQVAALCDYRKQPMQIDTELLSLACANLFHSKIELGTPRD